MTVCISAVLFFRLFTFWLSQTKTMLDTKVTWCYWDTDTFVVSALPTGICYQYTKINYITAAWTFHISLQVTKKWKKKYPEDFVGCGVYKSSLWLIELATGAIGPLPLHSAPCWPGVWLSARHPFTRIGFCTMLYANINSSFLALRRLPPTWVAKIFV